MILSPTYREVYRFLDQEVAAIMTSNYLYYYNDCMGVHLEAVHELQC